MSRFIHIDHCLCRFGGHEYDYAVNLLEAAEAAGYEVALATNRRFRDAARLPRHWPVYPVFPRTAYSKHCAWYGGDKNLPLDLSGRRLAALKPDISKASIGRRIAAGLAALRGLAVDRDRRRCIDGFASACHSLFEQIRLRPGDHVFFATITEFDLLGLAGYLREHSATRAATWHLQFHFGLAGHNQPGQEQREGRQRAAAQQFQHALGQLPHHQLRFYNTTEELAAEYNQLEVGRFRYMPYPASPELRTSPVAARGPLRITCAGAVRRDKRIRDLKAIAQAVRGDAFFDRRVKLVAQLPKRKARRLGISPLPADDDKAHVVFETPGHPLERDAYHDLIRRVDIGLFLHDSRRYASQCSGVLHELLAAGKPVIVPAGSWLAEQVAPSIAKHIETLRQGLPRVGHFRADEIRWRSAATESSGGSVGPLKLRISDGSAYHASLAIPTSATEMVLRFRCADQDVCGRYVRLETAQFDAAGNLLKKFDCIPGRRQVRSATLAMMHLDPRATRVDLVLRGAYDGPDIVVERFEADFLRAARQGGCPAGSVGLIAAVPGQIPDLLRDMVAHYPHYRQTADSFSEHWLKAHHPSQTIRMLTSDDDDARRAAA